MVGTEAVAMEEMAAGNPADFKALVEQHSRGVFRLAYRMTGNEQDAEEVVQETFLRAYRAFDRFEARAQFGTWLHRIAVNCSLDLLRARQRRNEHRQPAPREDEDDPIHSLPSGEPGPERLVLNAEVQRRLQATLKRLSPTERAAFVLRHYEGKSIEEIGRELRLGSNATKNSIFRAVQKLRAALEPLVNRTL